MSAKARPSAVVPKPTRTPRNSVFQATPQRRSRVRAVEAPDRAVEEFGEEFAGAKLPCIVLNGAGEDRRDRKEDEDDDQRDDDADGAT